MQSIHSKLQGLAFTLEERQVLGIHGLQPARFKSQEEQIELCKISINRYQEDLNKYLYLIDLQVRLFDLAKSIVSMLIILNILIDFQPARNYRIEMNDYSFGLFQKM